MKMQMDACLKKEQIGTLFVRVGAPERGGGLGGGGQGGPPQKVYMPSKKKLLGGVQKTRTPHRPPPLRFDPCIYQSKAVDKRIPNMQFLIDLTCAVQKLCLLAPPVCLPKKLLLPASIIPTTQVVHDVEAHFFYSFSNSV